jgi:amidase
MPHSSEPNLSDCDRRTFALGLGSALFGHALRGAPAPQAVKPPARGSELCFISATELARRLRRKEVSAREVMTAHLGQIERVNQKVNAIVTLVADRAMANAARADESLAKGNAVGALHGLPVAHKDLVDTAGIRTTRGSLFYRDNIPARDALIVARIREAGAIALGKTNTPELGAGSQTFNQVFGATRNPYDLTKTCGGSSGGAAVALACGMVPIADGSDTGGSLRNPAAFCNVVGFRTSPGRVPMDTGSWSPLSVRGPMARSVEDAALFLSAIAGPDARSPLALSDSGDTFRRPLQRRFKGVRVAWWKSLGGIPFEAEVKRVIDAQRKIFDDLGCVVEEAEPDFTGVAEAFPIIRYTSNHPQNAPLVRQRPDWVKDTVKFEVAEAERLTAADVGRALATQSRFYDRSRQFFEKYDYFILPVTQVAPFAVNVPYPTVIEGQPMATYIDWMRSCWYVTFMGTPAISVPAGFTVAGLPVGLQIVGRHRDDWECAAARVCVRTGDPAWSKTSKPAHRNRLMIE